MHSIHLLWFPYYNPYVTIYIYIHIIYIYRERHLLLNHSYIHLYIHICIHSSIEPSMYWIICLPSYLFVHFILTVTSFRTPWNCHIPHTPHIPAVCRNITWRRDAARWGSQTGGVSLAMPQELKLGFECAPKVRNNCTFGRYFNVIGRLLLTSTLDKRGAKLQEDSRVCVAHIMNAPNLHMMTSCPSGGRAHLAPFALEFRRRRSPAALLPSCLLTPTPPAPWVKEVGTAIPSG